MGMETPRTIVDWGLATFGSATPQALIRRLHDEVKELAAIELDPVGDSYEQAADECADVYIMLCQVMSHLGFHLASCVDHKMQINRARQWIIQQDGTGQHVPSNQQGVRSWRGSIPEKKCTESLTKAEQGALSADESFDADLEIRRRG